MRKILLILLIPIMVACNKESEKDSSEDTSGSLNATSSQLSTINNPKIPIVNGVLVADKKLKGVFKDLNSFFDIYTQEELEQITAIHLRENELTSMTGIERLTNVTYIVLSRNEISKIEGLVQLEKLTDLEMTRNKLNDIGELRNLTGILGLDIRGELNDDNDEYWEIVKIVYKNNPDAKFLEF